MKIAAYVFGSVSLLMSMLLFLRIQAPKGFIIWFPKLAAGALSPLWAVFGSLGMLLSLLGRMPLAAIESVIGTACMVWYIWTVTRQRPVFEAAFGSVGKQAVTVASETGWRKIQWANLLPGRDMSKSCLKADIPFWTIPGSSRELLCDIWQPAPGTKPSGLVVIFFHGSAWYLFNKDFGTRPFFSHLVAEGHVVVDVAYRLCPEVDIFGMVGDVKRAVAWVKANAQRYGGNPERIVLAGASAGGHLALLAAYAAQHPLLTPDDGKNIDLNIHGVISLYGPSDLRAVYSHTNQQNLVGLPKVPIGQDPAQSQKKMGDAGRLDILVGGHPFEVPDNYDLASPICHVHPGCPPTLLIQGQHDLITPVTATRALFHKLIQSGIPAISIEFPCTEHGFDLMLPQISPSYQAALHSIDRFLSILA